MGVENELEDNFPLSIPTLEGYLFELFSFCFLIFICFLECVKKIISHMGMQLCEQLDEVVEGEASNTFHLAGIYRSGYDVLVRAKMTFEKASADPGATTISMALKIRSTNHFAAVQVMVSTTQVETYGTSTVVFIPYFAVIQAGELLPYF